MPVRSDRLYSGRLANAAAADLFTVPEGITVLVKSINVYSHASGQGSVLFHAFDPSGAHVVLVRLTTSQSGSSYWDGWVAMDPGSRLRAENTAGNLADLWVSGTKLIGTAADFPTALPGRRRG